MSFPQIILLNGASSSGKTTLSTALQETLPIPYFYLSSDQLADSGMFPNVDRATNDTPWSWNILRPIFFSGFHKSIAAFASAGNYLLVEHVVERSDWLDELALLLKDFSVFYIGVMCPLEEIEKRERQRGNRFRGEGKSHLEDGIHTWSNYDITVDTSKLSPKENAQLILSSIEKQHNNKTVFNHLFETIRQKNTKPHDIQ